MQYFRNDPDAGLKMGPAGSGSTDTHADTLLQSNGLDN
jgi:hypothetical protein